MTEWAWNGSLKIEKVNAQPTLLTTNFQQQICKETVIAAWTSIRVEVYFHELHLTCIKIQLQDQVFVGFRQKKVDMYVNSTSTLSWAIYQLYRLIQF